MPGIGHQHARLDALGHREHVAEQEFLRDECATGHPERDDVDRLHGAGVFELAKGRPQHARADGQQQHAQHQRGGGLEALVAVRVVLVGVLLAVVTGEQDDKVRHQVRERMDAVGHQALRPGQHTDGDLGSAHEEVDHDADPGAAGRGRRALLGAVFGVFGIIGKFGELHGKLARLAAVCGGVNAEAASLPFGPDHRIAARQENGISRILAGDFRRSLNLRRWRPGGVDGAKSVPGEHEPPTGAKSSGHVQSDQRVGGAWLARVAAQGERDRQGKRPESPAPVRRRRRRRTG